MLETGHFAFPWQHLALRLGLNPQLISTDWRRGADPALIEQALREAIDAAGHPALLMVDTTSELGSADFRFDEWRVDVAVSGSQKGLMLPPDLSFNAVSTKALAALDYLKSTRQTCKKRR